MIEENLTKYKGSYLNITVPGLDIEEKWKLLADNLPQQVAKTDYRFVRYVAASLGAIVILVIMTVGASQASKPGQALYGIKNLTQQFTTQISNIPTDIGKIFPRSLNKTSNIGNLNLQATASAKPTVHPTSTKEKDNHTDNDQIHVNIRTIEPTLTIQPQEHGNSNNSGKSNEEQVKGASTQNQSANGQGNSNNSSSDSSNGSDHGNDRKNK